MSMSASGYELSLEVEQQGLLLTYLACTSMLKCLIDVVHSINVGEEEVGQSSLNERMVR